LCLQIYYIVENHYARIFSLSIPVQCQPMLMDEDVLYDSKFDLDVK